jgi:ribosomal-protein-alanine N-acetyltransferase
MGYKIRRMRPEDIPQVAQAERESFPTTWPPTPFKRELGNRLARYLVAVAPYQICEREKFVKPASTPDHYYVVVKRCVLRLIGMLIPSRHVAFTSQDFIVGYIGIWFMSDEAHIISIAVRNAYRRRGVGELLLQGSLELAMIRKCRVMSLEVRASNTGARALYKKYGFNKMGVRKGYYADNSEDAVIMTTEAIASLEYQNLFSQSLEFYRYSRGESARDLP